MRVKDSELHLTSIFNCLSSAEPSLVAGALCVTCSECNIVVAWHTTHEVIQAFSMNFTLGMNVYSNSKDKRMVQRSHALDIK